MSLWLDYRRESGVPILLEYQAPYAHFKDLSEAPQMILVVRGPRTDSMAREVYIHHERIGLAIECALHLKSDLGMHREVQGDVSRHFLDKADGLPLDKIAQYFYSLVLAPIALCIVFVRGEFDKIDDIMYILALWASLREGERRRTTRPLVLIIGTKRTERELERLLVAEIGASFNPRRDGSRETFNTLWTTCFSGLARGAYSHTSDTSLSSILRQAVATSTDMAMQNPVTTAGRLCPLLKISCRNFSNFFGILLTPTSAFRTHPFSGWLKSCIEQVFTLGLPRALAVSLVLVWLIQDAHEHELDITGM